MHVRREFGTQALNWWQSQVEILQSVKKLMHFTIIFNYDGNNVIN